MTIKRPGKMRISIKIKRLGMAVTLTSIWTIRGTGSEDLRLAGLADPVGFQAEARKAINAASGQGAL